MDHMDHGSGSRSQAGTRLSLRHNFSDIVCNCNKGTSVPLNKPGGMALFVASSRDTSTDEIKHPPNTPCTVKTPILRVTWVTLIHAWMTLLRTYQLCLKSKCKGIQYTE